MTPPPLSPAQLAAVRPNELGVVPVLMYHDFIDAPAAAEYTRTLDDFRADLQRLYELDYYVIPLRDLITNRIAAPAGKHPVVLTFDDGTAGQFRYLVGEDGSLAIDPASAVGVMEAFYADHPDFGRGGFFAVPPTSCFDWERTGAEPDQTPYCAQKLRWLIANGYEIGNHTLDHADLLNLDDRTFAEKVGRGVTELRALVPGVAADILAMPFGNYPDPKRHPHQREWMRTGFTYEGTEIRILGALMVGANPAVSPVSTAWDPLYIARIRAYDGELGSTEWLTALAKDPSQLYTSDGDPDTITLPTELPPALAGTFDAARAEADGKRVVEYDPATGMVT